MVSPPNNSSADSVSYEDVSTITAMMVGLVAVLVIIMVFAVLAVVILYRKNVMNYYTPVTYGAGAESMPIMQPPKLHFPDFTA